MTRIKLSSSRSSSQKRPGAGVDDRQFKIRITLSSNTFLHQMSYEQHKRKRKEGEEVKSHGTVDQHRPMISKIMNSRALAHHHRFLQCRRKDVCLARVVWMVILVILSRYFFSSLLHYNYFSFCTMILIRRLWPRFFSNLFPHISFPIHCKHHKFNRGNNFLLRPTTKKR
jgi:hypothetical protein